MPETSGKEPGGKEPASRASNLTVAVRVRPLSIKEKARQSWATVEVLDDTHVMVRGHFSPFLSPHILRPDRQHSQDALCFHLFIALGRLMIQTTRWVESTTSAWTRRRRSIIASILRSARRRRRPRCTTRPTSRSSRRQCKATTLAALPTAPVRRQPPAPPATICPIHRLHGPIGAETACNLRRIPQWLRVSRHSLLSAARTLTCPHGRLAQLPPRRGLHRASPSPSSVPRPPAFPPSHQARSRPRTLCAHAPLQPAPARLSQ